MFAVSVVDSSLSVDGLSGSSGLGAGGLPGSVDDCVVMARKAVCFPRYCCCFN